MKYVLAGTFLHYLYEPICTEALQSLGHNVIPVAWGSYLRSPIGRAETKLTLPGPYSFAVNARLRLATLREQPDVVFVWRGTSVWPSTVRWLRSHSKARLISYNNDDPFGLSTS